MERGGRRPGLTRNPGRSARVTGRMRHRLIALALPAALAACGGGSERAEQNADLLENAADQSTPAAAAVLENAADRIEEQDVALPPGHPDSSVQQAMDRAGAAQAEANRGGTAPTPVPPPVQAVPHGADKGNPPPTVRTPPSQ